MSGPTPAQTIFETKDKAPTSQSEKVADGFQNFASKLGVSPRGQQPNADNLVSKGVYTLNIVTRNRVELENAYRGNWIVRKMIDIFAKDMTRAGITINTNEGAEQIQEFKAAMSRLKIWKSIGSTIKWGKLYGGACGVVQIKGQSPEQPLDLDTVGKGQFKGITVYDRWQLYPVLDKLIEEGPDMGLPAYYDIVLGSNLNDPGREPGGQETVNATGRVRVHHSRCIRMIGNELPFFQAITEMMWGESVLENIWDLLIYFNDVTANTANLVQRAYLRTVGIDGFREVLAAGGQAEEALISQFAYMRKFQDNDGLTLLDKNDVFATTAYSFAGLSDVITQFGQQVSGGIDIPLVLLFGQSPAGLSATGESDIRLYYDGVNAKQEEELRNPVEMIVKILWRSLFGKPAPTDLTFTFTSLWQMTAKDKADIAKVNTDTIIEAHQEGLVDTPTAMKELKQTSGDSGIFTHITDEQIEDAENEEPPMPEAGLPGEGTGDPGESPTDPADKVKNAGLSGPDKATDSAWKRIKKWLTQDGTQ